MHSAYQSLLQSGEEIFDVIKPKVVSIEHIGVRFPNGTRCIVVVDPNCQLAAAAVSMRVGSNQDPPNLPGLAHFCEHMLFMGTEKFPKEDEFDSFVSKNGGHTNAWTADMSTTYYFNTAQQAFSEAVDRFLEFFVAPSFSPSAVEREIQAVHSEDEKNHSVDYWRIDELFRCMTDPRHPRCRYGNGNETTLWTIPRENGIDVREALVSFYERYYTADAMALVLYSRMTLEEALPILRRQLLRMREPAAATESDHRMMNCFIPQLPPSLPKASADDTTATTGYNDDDQNAAEERGGSDAEDVTLRRTAPFAREEIGRWYAVVTNKRSRAIRVLFPYPEPSSCRSSKIAGYASHILGHECGSSVLGVLKRCGFAVGLTCGAGHARDDDDNVFYVEVSLTEKGFGNLLEVTSLFFEGIDMLRRHGNVHEATFLQMMQEDTLQFEMLDMQRAETHASDLSSSLLTASNPSEAWREDSVATSPDRDAAFALIRDYLKPSNCVVMVMWDGFPTAPPPPTGTEPARPMDEEDEKQKEALQEDAVVSIDDTATNSEECDDKKDNSCSSLSPEAQKLFAALPDFAQLHCTQSTRFHKTRYSFVTIPADVIRQWERVVYRKVDEVEDVQSEGEIAAGDGQGDMEVQYSQREGCVVVAKPSGLDFPPVNPFLASDFTVFPPLVALEDGVSSSTSLPLATPPLPLPIALRHPYGTSFIRLSSPHFPVPKACATVEFLSLVSYRTPLNRFFSRVMQQMVKHDMTELLYLGESASINNSVSPGVTGLVVAVDGPSHRLNDFFLQVVRKSLNKATLKGDAALFQSYSDLIRRTLQSVATQQPYELATDRISAVVTKTHYTFDDILPVALSAEEGGCFEKYCAFVDAYLSEGMRYTLVASGNFPDEASFTASWVAPLEAILSESVGKPLTVETCPELLRLPCYSVLFPAAASDEGLRRGSPQPAATTVLELDSFNPADPNSTVLVEFELGEETPLLRAHADCLQKMISSKFFNALRTKEALGYVVFTGATRHSRICTLRFGVQSAVAHADVPYLLSRVMAFIDAVEAAWSRLCSDKTLVTILEGLIRAREELPKSLVEATAVMYSDLKRPSGFSRIENELKVLRLSVKHLSDKEEWCGEEMLTISSITRLFQQRVSNRSSEARRLVVGIRSKAIAEDSVCEESLWRKSVKQQVTLGEAMSEVYFSWTPPAKFTGSSSKPEVSNEAAVGDNTHGDSSTKEKTDKAEKEDDEEEEEEGPEAEEDSESAAAAEDAADDGDLELPTYDNNMRDTSSQSTLPVWVIGYITDLKACKRIREHEPSLSQLWLDMPVLV